MKKPAAVLLTVVVLSAPAYAFDFGSLKDQLKDLLGGSNQNSTTATNKSGVDSLTPSEISSGLKEALNKGVDAAVAQLGKKDGFWANPQLRIPLPSDLQKAGKLMRSLGMGNQVDALELDMNRAAEAAVPEAKNLLIGAVKDMTLEDAKGILTGGDTAATDFFRKKTQVALDEKFLPIVKQTTDQVGLARTYNAYARIAARFGAIKDDQASIESYVTKESLDRLYQVIGEQEKAFRANPLQSGSELIRKVFGSLLNK
jgi:hypothetical protein